eukprot:1256782-Pyramimonas_sp.AAC.2
MTRHQGSWVTFTYVYLRLLTFTYAYTFGFCLDLQVQRLYANSFIYTTPRLQQNKKTASSSTLSHPCALSYYSCIHYTHLALYLGANRAKGALSALTAPCRAASLGYLVTWSAATCTAPRKR